MALHASKDSSPRSLPNDILEWWLCFMCTHSEESGTPPALRNPIAVAPSTAVANDFAVLVYSRIWWKKEPSTCHIRKTRWWSKCCENQTLWASPHPPLLEGVFETSDCRFRHPSGASRHIIPMCDDGNEFSCALNIFVFELLSGNPKLGLRNDAFISDAWFQPLLTVEVLTVVPVMSKRLRQKDWRDREGFSPSRESTHIDQSRPASRIPEMS
jgi:hypothetical protein